MPVVRTTLASRTREAPSRRLIRFLKINVAMRNCVLHNCFVHRNNPGETVMNPIEKQAQLVRELFELNTATVRQITELSTENFKKYMELNQDYAQKLPEVRDISTFVELQREYGQSLWEGLREDLSARGTIARDAVEQTGGLIRGAFSSEEASVEEEVVAPKAASKAA